MSICPWTVAVQRWCESDDVQNVYANFEVSDTLMAKLSA